MASLSKSLLAVIEGLTSSEYKSVGAHYTTILESQADALDQIGVKSNSASQVERAGLVTTAAQILVGDRGVTPQSAPNVHQTSISKNWNQWCRLPAACIIFVQNPVEAALALKLITYIQATFAIRSTGHSPAPGFSSIGQSGVLLDLGDMKNLQVSDDRETVTVESGVTWDRVYEELEKYERTAVGGRSTSVGVTGLILGGGMSHFTTAWGCACDAVKNFEVILSDSTFVQANATVNADLYRALKGGATNFGLVTKMELYTKKEYKIWSNFKVYPVHEAERVMRASVQVQEAMEQDDKIGLIVIDGVGYLSVGILYRDWLDSPPEVYRFFEGIESIMEPIPAQNSTQAEFCKQLGAMAHPSDAPQKREVAALTVRPNVDLYVEFNKIVSRIHTTKEFPMQFTFQPVGTQAAKMGQQNHGNAFSLPSEKQSWVVILGEWSDDKFDKQCPAEVKQILEDFKSVAQSRDLEIPYNYMNDCSPAQSPLETYGADNLAFLKEVAGRYDASRVFQKLQNGGYLLSKIKN